MYRVIDNAPNWELRTKCYSNKGQALLYARNLKKHLSLGYCIEVEKIKDSNGCWHNTTRIARFNSIGNSKR